jgi:Ca2+-binding RTX toxin-like protein
MFAAAFPRGARMLPAAFAVVVCAGLVAPAALGRAGASSGRDRLAARVMRLDPGALIGGNTQVATAAGARLFGVPRRVNFMIALGPRERIVGGARHDELGARGAAAARIYGAGGNDLIHGGGRDQRLAGGLGNDLIYGGAGRDRLRGGPGNDRLIDKRGPTTVRPGPGRNEVDVADGQGDDRVLCRAGARDRVKADRGDRLGSGCRQHGSRVLYRSAPTAAPLAQAAYTGAGTNANPYTAPCDVPEVDCTVSTFAGRILNHYMSNEYVPAYQCPLDHAYLLNKNYAPFGTSLPEGVEIFNLGNVGVSITGAQSRYASDGKPYPVGTLTGFPSSSATNWAVPSSTQAYQVILHCTSDLSHSIPA